MREQETEEDIKRRQQQQLNQFYTTLPQQKLNGDTDRNRNFICENIVFYEHSLHNRFVHTVAMTYTWICMYIFFLAKISPFALYKTLTYCEIK